MVSSKNVIMEEKLCVRWKKLTQRKKKQICEPLLPLVYVDKITLR